NDFPTKFGLPRQSGLIDDLPSQIVFEPAFRRREALRGLEGFTHVWLLWGFSDARREEWSATVRPPRLGGNRRMGVFATRSPYRPNPIGLSCVRLVRIDPNDPRGLVLHVAGADLMDGTPIFDIKPYLPYTDCRPEAVGGFAEQTPQTPLTVVFPAPWLALIPPESRTSLQAVLASDPRPAYQDDPARVYGFAYAGFDVRFSVNGDVLNVTQVVPL
ncbi:MAG: tRNA (N6-threonylcarbamoyladenosine(37)-N6)-methyltransferase TrmO, partial [Eubacteriales bacterium]|nr:tRNA (N6-threonylcarbamoyladenosine(37)-N6)-methyltransferase TrmO [Eubacteriales bacterium]